MRQMKKWAAPVILVVAAAVFFAVMLVPHTGLPPSRAESIMGDGVGSRLLKPEESEAIAERLAQVSFRTDLSGSRTFRGYRIILFFDDREEQTILYCIEDGMLYLTQGSHRYVGKDAAVYEYLHTLLPG